MPWNICLLARSFPANDRRSLAISRAHQRHVALRICFHRILDKAIQHPGHVGPHTETAPESALVILPRVRIFDPSAACVSLFPNLAIRVAPESRGQIRI